MIPSPLRSANVSDPGPLSHKHSLHRCATKTLRKSVAIYSPSQIYPLKSLPISFSPWATNYRETSTTSWAVICGAAVPHPLDLLSLSPTETASFSTINSSSFFLSYSRMAASFFLLLSPSSRSCNDLHSAPTIRREVKKKPLLNNIIHFLLAVDWLIIWGEGWQL